MVTTNNENSIVATCTRRMAACEQYVPASGTIVLHAQPVTQAEAAGVYQECLDLRKKLVTLRGQVAAVLAARRQADAKMSAFDTAMRDWVATTFGPTSQAAIDYGYAPKPRAKPDVETLVLAQAKAEATRKARGTVGPKKRLKIRAPSTAPMPAQKP